MSSPASPLRPRDTLGPFSPTVSHSRSLLSVEKTMREMNHYAARAMPTESEHEDRSVLTGVRIMLRAARTMESNAKNNLKRIKQQGGSNDPRAVMREQLGCAQREAARPARQR